jgi:flagellar biosynthesis/type III secretory pathway protein FliH
LTLNLEDDQELMMNLTQAYEEARAQAVQEGFQQGFQQGFRQGVQQVLENLLKYRFGSVDEELARVVESLLQLSSEEFIPLCLQLPREELLARFSK